MDPCNSGLPDELLLRFFDGASIEELCRLSRVSRKWRAIALSHPTFWTAASIREWQLARGGLQCFLARMARCPEAGVAAELDFHERVPPAVLACVAANLHRITELRMGCNLRLWPVESLDVPAPRLERLEMQAWQAQPFLRLDTSMELRQRRSIFAGCAPRLHTVKLTNTLFLLSLAGPHLSFPSVRAVDISYSAPPDVVAADIFDRVAALFPAVRTLKVELFNYTPGGPAERFAAAPLNDAASRTIAGLQELRLCFSLACKATLRHLPLADIPKVELTNHVFNEVEIVPSLIPDGDYCVSYEGTPQSSNCRVSVWNFDSGSDSAQRRVLDASDGQSLRNCARTMRAYLVSSRIFALSLDIRAWGTLLECIEVLPSLAVLRLVICAMDTTTPWLDGTSGSLSGVIRCPSLHTWVMDAYAEHAALNTAYDMSRAAAQRLCNSVRFDQRQATLILRWVALQEAEGEGKVEEADGPCNVAFARELVDNSADAAWFEQIAAQAYCARCS